jgi:hypothetical protein
MRLDVRMIRLLSALAALSACLLAGGCTTHDPPAVSSGELAQAETFPYYEIYWVGRDFAHNQLTAADGQKNYNSSIGDSVYYGDCVEGKGILSTGSCHLPLQVTTVIYRLHSNATLGSQRNTLIRGVPATIYEEGRSIELYSGRVAIDLFASTPAATLRAANELRPLNAPGSDESPLPLPVYCPGLSGPEPQALRQTLNSLPGRACQIAAARTAAQAKYHQSR